MYTYVNNDLIYFDINPYIEVSVMGGDKFYLVEVREYRKNQESSFLVESFHISPTLSSYFAFFECGIEFYYDFEINVYKFIDDIGVKKIFSHRYNDTGKLVRFNLITDNLEEAKIWNSKVLEYQKIHNCRVSVVSNFDEINRSYLTYYETYNLKPYKTYNIGRFPKISKDFKSNDPRTFGYLMFGYWKKAWSYQHPNSWTKLSSEEIANDILGL